MALRCQLNVQNKWVKHIEINTWASMWYRYYDTRVWKNDIPWARAKGISIFSDTSVVITISHTRECVNFFIIHYLLVYTHKHLSQTNELWHRWFEGRVGILCNVFRRMTSLRFTHFNIMRYLNGYTSLTKTKNKTLRVIFQSLSLTVFDQVKHFMYITTQEL